MGFLDRIFGKPTPGRFAARLIEALTRAGETDELRYVPVDGVIQRQRDGRPIGVISIANMYPKYCGLPRNARERYFRSCVRAILTVKRTLPDDFDAARPDLRPRIWSHAAVETLRLRSLVEENDANTLDLPSVAVGDHLLASVAYDWPESVQSVSKKDLDRWGVSLYEAMEAASMNLAEDQSAYAALGDNNLYGSLSGDSYDASRLMLIDRIKSLEVKGPHVAMVPNREMLLVTGADDEVGLALMLELAEKGLKESYALSGVPLVLEDDVWTDWRPPEGHPLRRRFAELEVRWIWPEYAAQKQLLEQALQKQGVDLFVATFSVMEQKGTGALMSYCTWGEGVEALLPVTQQVVFMREGQGPIVAPWDRVLAVAGHLMEPTEYYPARFRVREFPDGTVLANLAKES